MIQGFRRRKSSKIIAFDKKLKKTSIIKEILKNNDPIHMNKRNSIAIVLTSKGPEKTRSSASLFQTSRTQPTEQTFINKTCQKQPIIEKTIHNSLIGNDCSSVRKNFQNQISYNLDHQDDFRNTKSTIFGELKFDRNSQNNGLHISQNDYSPRTMGQNDYSPRTMGQKSVGFFQKSKIELDQIEDDGSIEYESERQEDSGIKKVIFSDINSGQNDKIEENGNRVDSFKLKLSQLHLGNSTPQCNYPFSNRTDSQIAGIWEQSTLPYTNQIKRSARDLTDRSRSEICNTNDSLFHDKNSNRTSLIVESCIKKDQTRIEVNKDEIMQQKSQDSEEKPDYYDFDQNPSGITFVGKKQIEIEKKKKVNSIVITDKDYNEAIKENSKKKNNISTASFGNIPTFEKKQGKFTRHDYRSPQKNKSQFIFEDVTSTKRNYPRNRLESKFDFNTKGSNSKLRTCTNIDSKKNDHKAPNTLKRVATNNVESSNLENPYHPRSPTKKVCIYDFTTLSAVKSHTLTALPSEPMPAKNSFEFFWPKLRILSLMIKILLFGFQLALFQLYNISSKFYGRKHRTKSENIIFYLIICYLMDVCTLIFSALAICLYFIKKFKTREFKQVQICINMYCLSFSYTFANTVIVIIFFYKEINFLFILTQNISILTILLVLICTEYVEIKKIDFLIQNLSNIAYFSITGLLGKFTKQETASETPWWKLPFWFYLFTIIAFVMIFLLSKFVQSCCEKSHIKRNLWKYIEENFQRKCEKNGSEQHQKNIGELDLNILAVNALKARHGYRSKSVHPMLMSKSNQNRNYGNSNIVANIFISNTTNNNVNCQGNNKKVWPRDK